MPKFYPHMICIGVSIGVLYVVDFINDGEFTPITPVDSPLSYIGDYYIIIYLIYI